MENAIGIADPFTHVYDPRYQLSFVLCFPASCVQTAFRFDIFYNNGTWTYIALNGYSVYNYRVLYNGTVTGYIFQKKPIPFALFLSKQLQCFSESCFLLKVLSNGTLNDLCSNSKFKKLTTGTIPPCGLFWEMKIPPIDY